MRYWPNIKGTAHLFLVAIPWRFSHSVFFLPAFSSIFPAYLSTVLSKCQGFLYSLTYEKNTKAEGTPAPPDDLISGMCMMKREN